MSNKTLNHLEALKTTAADLPARLQNLPTRIRVIIAIILVAAIAAGVGAYAFITNRPYDAKTNPNAPHALEDEVTIETGSAYDNLWKEFKLKVLATETQPKVACFEQPFEALSPNDVLVNAGAVPKWIYPNGSRTQPLPEVIPAPYTNLENCFFLIFDGESAANFDSPSPVHPDEVTPTIADHFTSQHHPIPPTSIAYTKEETLGLVGFIDWYFDSFTSPETVVIPESDFDSKFVIAGDTEVATLATSKGKLFAAINLLKQNGLDGILHKITECPTDKKTGDSCLKGTPLEGKGPLDRESYDAALQDEYELDGDTPPVYTVTIEGSFPDSSIVRDLNTTSKLNVNGKDYVASVHPNGSLTIKDVEEVVNCSQACYTITQANGDPYFTFKATPKHLGTAGEDKTQAVQGIYDYEFKVTDIFVNHCRDLHMNRAAPKSFITKDETTEEELCRNYIKEPYTDQIV